VADADTGPGLLGWQERMVTEGGPPVAW
jgi:hypothetical protein